MLLLEGNMGFLIIVGKGPSNFRSMLSSVLLRNVLDCFRLRRFGIISAFDNRSTKRENFQRQWQLAQILKSRGFSYYPIFGNWNWLQMHTLFILDVTREQIEIVAREANQTRYIFGEKKVWFGYSTDRNNSVSPAVGLVFCEFDHEFALYSQIARKKEHFLAMAKGIETNHRILDAHLQKTLSGITNKLAELEAKERKIFGDTEKPEFLKSTDSLIQTI